ncbi:hypothetical protein PTI98_011805 [Pleurotus ostreatus]|nr:hypothetical protein PTI98_011805 [Pleurotus ostreatus]
MGGVKRYRLVFAAGILSPFKYSTHTTVHPVSTSDTKSAVAIRREHWEIIPSDPSVCCEHSRLLDGEIVLNIPGSFISLLSEVQPRSLSTCFMTSSVLDIRTVVFELTLNLTSARRCR